MRIERSVTREVAFALIFKATALMLIYFAFFGPAHQTMTTPAAVASYLLGAATSAFGQ